MTLSKQNIWRSVGALIAVIVIIKDQLSKWWLMAHVFGDMYKDGAPDFATWLTTSSERFSHASLEVTSYFNLAMVWNPGISFGMLRTDTPFMVYLLAGVAVCVAVGFFVWLWREPRPFFAICIGLIVGGALGNVLDRLRFGAVVDFLDVHVGGWHWPAFNVADASISIGVVLLLVDMIFFTSKTSHEGAVNETL